jgi:hypothetical protein
MKHLSQLLNRSRIFNIQGHSHQQKTHQQQAEYQQLHGECLRDRRLRVIGLNMHSVQNLCRQTPEVLVKRSGNRVLMHNLRSSLMRSSRGIGVLPR